MRPIQHLYTTRYVTYLADSINQMCLRRSPVGAVYLAILSEWLREFLNFLEKTLAGYFDMIDTLF